MKKTVIFFITALLISNTYSQVLFTYGSNAVTKYEFLKAYNKNKTTVADKSVALKEYLNLYINFKLKVKAAKDMRLDTLPSLINDLQNFRAQIEEGYLNDESRVTALTQQAYERSKKDIHVAYLFFPLKEYPDLASVEKAAEKINRNDIGFITVFSLPYEFEDVVYNLKPGESSKPISTKNGYYIFKNVEERKAVGKIKAAQILIALPEGAKEEDNINTKRLADSIYHLLQAGRDFGELAKQFSNDKLTYLSGGVMPEFGVGRYDPVFEAQVFSLQKDGEIAAPFQTKFGYHIVKRISATPVPAELTDAYLYTLKQQVLADKRIAFSKEKFLNDVLKKLHFKKNTAVKESVLWKLTDSLIATDKKLSSKNNLVLFTVNNQRATMNDWILFLKEYRNNNQGTLETYRQIMDKFIAKVAIDNYKTRLPEFNPEFKYQLQEFKDGNMLFEVMERNVWNKASNDSGGLKNYFIQHKAKYTWNESADAILFSCSNEKAANDIAAQIKKEQSWKQVTAENVTQLQTDSGRYELSQLPAKLNTKFINGMVTEPLVNENDGTATFVKIIKLYPPHQQRNFEDARGMVINDYQNFLEEKWIQRLKKKYPVKINEKVFHSLL